jgi:hypothetical protein
MPSQPLSDEECIAVARFAAENPGLSITGMARRYYPEITQDAARNRFRDRLAESERRGLLTGQESQPPRYHAPQGPPAPPQMLADYIVRTAPASPPAPFTEKDFLSLGKPPALAEDMQEEYSPPFVDPVQYGGAIFDRLAEGSAKKIQERREKPHDLVIRRIQTDSPILLTNFSDVHLGYEFTDHQRALEDMRLIRDTPGAFATFGGDGIDNHIKHRSAMITAKSSPAEQFAALEYFLSEGGGKLLAGISGNHEYWTKGFAGLDYLTTVFGRLKIAYTPHRLRLILKVNEQEYRIEVRHTYRFKSSLNLSNQLQRMYDYTDWQWDIGCVGHTHDGPFVVPFDRHGRSRWGSLTGSYKVFCDHSEQWGFNHAAPSSPAFILYPDRHEIVGFKDVRVAVAYLNAIRSART